MVEQSENREISFPEKFEVLRDYYKNAIEDGRNSGKALFQDIYEKEDSMYNANSCDNDMLQDIAMQFNSKWVGRNTNGRR